MRVEANETYGFSVKVDPQAEYWDAYRVSLPHQCDAWLIVSTGDKAKAVEQMEQFVAEAMLALARLKELSAPLPG